MRYVVATFGATFIFAVVFIFCAVVCANVLPENINHMKIKFYLGSFYVFANPSVLIGAPVAIAAAILTFRSAVHRYTVKRDEPKPPSDTL